MSNYPVPCSILTCDQDLDHPPAIPLFPPAPLPPLYHPCLSLTHPDKAFVQNDTLFAVWQDNHTLAFQSLKYAFPRELLGSVTLQCILPVSEHGTNLQSLLKLGHPLRKLPPPDTFGSSSRFLLTL